MGEVENFVRQFERMVSREGGALTLLSATEGLLRVGYQVGKVPTCTDGACSLTHIELQELMNEAISRRSPNVRVVVEFV